MFWLLVLGIYLLFCCGRILLVLMFVFFVFIVGLLLCVCLFVVDFGNYCTCFSCVDDVA